MKKILTSLCLYTATLGISDAATVSEIIQMRHQLEEQMIESVRESEEKISIAELKAILETLTKCRTEFSVMLYNYFLQEFFLEENEERRNLYKDILLTIRRNSSYKSLFENVLMMDINKLISPEKIMEPTPVAIHFFDENGKTSIAEKIEAIQIEETLFQLIQRDKLRKLILEDRMHEVPEGEPVAGGDATR